MPSLATFYSRLTDPNVLLKSDAAWAPVADALAASMSPIDHEAFWAALDTDLKSRESTLGHIHKGHIYWRLTNHHLVQGNLPKALELLELARGEDEQRGGTHSAAIGLSSVLRPLFYRVRANELKFDDMIMALYDAMSLEERKQFAREVGWTHDITASGAVQRITPEAFGFISKTETREIIRAMYEETWHLIQRPSSSYFGGVFTLGSILEGMLDDLFTRDNERLWKLFRENTVVMSHALGRSKLQQSDYDLSMTLGEKSIILRLLALHATSPIPRPRVLLMLVIAEYRDLIHPRRQALFPFVANDYVAHHLFTLVSVLADSWWPEKITAQLAA